MLLILGYAHAGGWREEGAYGWAKMASVAQKLERLSASLTTPVPPCVIMLTEALLDRPKTLTLVELSI